MKWNLLPNSVRRDIARSGLTTSDARRLRITVPSDYRSNPRYELPYFNLDGEKIKFHRIRFVGDPLSTDRRGKVIRYSQPQDEPPRLYFPPLRHNWREIAENTHTQIIITEGEKKAACACKHGLPTVGLGGVFNWSSKGKPIADLNELNWFGRKVLIVFDSDAAGNKNVCLAEQKLATELRNRGASVRTVRLPSPDGTKVGIDDFIMSHGVPAFEALLRKQTDSFTYAELAHKKFEPIRWVVEGLLTVGLTMLCGKPKIGKSWLVDGMAAAVGSGTEVLGHYPCKKGDVLHLALEDTPRRFKQRLLKILRGAVAPRRAHVFFRWPSVEMGGIRELNNWLTNHPKARLVIIDTLALLRPRPRHDSNVYLADYDAIRALKSVADENNVAIVVVHHLRKAAALDPLEEISGSTGHTGAADTILVLKRARREEDGTLFITGRDVAEKQLAVKFDAEKGTWSVVGNAEDASMSNARKEIISSLLNIGHPAQPREVAKALGRNREAIKRTMLNMRQDGDLRLVSKGLYTVATKGNNSLHSPFTDFPTGDDSPRSPRSPPAGNGELSRQPKLRPRSHRWSV